MKCLVPLLLWIVTLSQANEEVVEENGSKQWALLVAGSNEWYNYRHQADISHAYKLLTKRGIPPSNIIVMMYDDIANNTQNPTPGQIINKPDGPNVYKGVKIDYKGDTVTPKNFLNILLGNQKALKGIGTGRVIKSGPKDNIFVNFADHGGPGVLCFPEEDLSAKELIDTLKNLSNAKKYSKLVLYIEACEAGSMFDNLLPRNTKILASTASARDESSFGCYCDYKNYPCLGDSYSVKWMEYFDGKVPSNESLFDNYQTIRTLTEESHVQLYGDYGIGTSGVKDFLGRKTAVELTEEADNVYSDESKLSTVPSREIALDWIKRMAKSANNQLTKIKYTELAYEIEKKRKFVDETVESIIHKTVDHDEVVTKEIENTNKKLHYDMLECYTNLYRLFSKKCFNLNKNPYVLKHFYKFANICQMDNIYQENAIVSINGICNESFPKITDTL